MTTADLLFNGDYDTKSYYTALLFVVLISYLLWKYYSKKIEEN
jgi:hypothetical protein